MKTLQDLYSEVIANDELKTEFMEAAKDGRPMEFLKAHDCEATAEELAAFMKECTTGELSDEELDDAAGGCNHAGADDGFISILTAGLYCVGRAIDSAVNGHNGRQNDQESWLCTIDD